MKQNKTKGKYSLRELQNKNASRCEKDIRPIKNWSEADWLMSLTGELGELCNLQKKINRGNIKLDKKVQKERAHELADTLCYLLLVASRMDIDLEDAVIEKFNIVSKRWNSKARL